MKLLKKFYCRVFQKALRLTIPFLPYRQPEILHTLKSIPSILLSNDVKSVMLVTDAGVYSLGLCKPLEEVLKENNIQCVVYKDVKVNPTVSNVEEARGIYIQNSCKALIAVGGGSPMDAAKAIGARIAHPKKSLYNMRGILKLHHRLPLLICAPTTAGTGSETTLASVITDAERGYKYAISSFPLIPKFAVLDAGLTIGLPPQLTATTGMDALTHAVEVFIGNSTTKDTREAAIEAIQLIFGNLEIAYRDANNLKARENMLRAAYLAGLAFTKSYVGNVHAIAHSLGGKYGIAHGLANAVLLPIVLRAYGASVESKLAYLAKQVGVVSMEHADDKIAAKTFIAHIQAMNDRMQIPRILEGIQEADIHEMASKAEKEANPLYPVPQIWDEKHFRKIYYQVGGLKKV